MTLKYYFDLLSQPSRALFIFMKLSKIPFQPCPVALRNGEHLTEEFKQEFSRFQKVPFIHDGDFKLNESVAILRYLSVKHDIDNQWYPKDLKKRARVDEYLEWQHNNIRAFCALYFQRKWLFPLITGTPAKPETIEKYESNMVNCLDQFEEIFLSKSKYVASDDKPTIADIFALCEIEQPRMAGFEPKDGRVLLANWMDRVKNDTKPYYDECNVLVEKIIAANKSGVKAKL